MAGYRDIVNEDGSLVDPSQAKRPEKPFEVIEEMYGMIWFLADALDLGEPGTPDSAAWVEIARERFKEGFEWSPSKKPPIKEQL